MPKNEYTCDCGCVHTELVEALREKMPNEKAVEHLARFYKIIGDTTRCKILYILKSHEICVCDIANVLSMSKSSVSHQLAKLRQYGFVKCKRVGKTVYYSLEDSHIEKVLNISIEHLNCGWKK